MKVDLNIPEVFGVEVAAICMKTTDKFWDIAILNWNSRFLKNVIVASQRYGCSDC